MKKVFLLIFLLILIGLYPELSLAYSPQTTHAGITEQVVDFYNLNNNIKINSRDKELIIQGAIDEDNPPVRSLNHFYDPVRGIGLNDYEKAVDWATKPNNGNDFTWDKSIEKYVQGDRAGALIGLGHILHLAEDMTVPDHTRNDSHIAEGLPGAYTGVSVYEKWAKEYKNRKTLDGTALHYKSLGLKPRQIDTLVDYFNNIAAYSNNNYVSPDTIENRVYQYSSPVVEKKVGDYAYGVDTYFYDEHKLYIEYKNRNGKYATSLINEDQKDYSVLEDYFPRLAKMAILSGAGIMELFFREAEIARAEYFEAEREKQIKIAKLEAKKNRNLTEGGLFNRFWYRTSYAVTDAMLVAFNSIADGVDLIGHTFYNGGSLVVNTAGNIVDLANFTTDELATISTYKIEEGVLTAARTVVSASQKVILYIQDGGSGLMSPALAYNPPVPTSSLLLSLSEQAQLISVLTETLGQSDGADSSSSVSTPAPVRHSHGGSSHYEAEITEVVSTSTATSTDTAQVLATTTATTTDEVATTTATSSDIVIDTSTTTATTTDDVATTTDSTATTTVEVDTEAPVVTFYDPPLCANSLSDDICLLTTTTTALIDFSWVSTSTDISFYTISVDDEVMATTSEDFIVMGLEPDSTYQVSLLATDTSGNISEADTYEIAIYSRPVIINEVAWMGTLASYTDEWLELYNITPYAINFEDWTLSTDDHGLDIILEDEIAAESFYILERTSSTTISDIAEDQIYTGDLKNAGETLTLRYGSTVIDQTPEISSGWPAGDNTRKTTMERVNTSSDGTLDDNWTSNDENTYNGLDADGNEIKGTPGSPNSSTVIAAW